MQSGPEKKMQEMKKGMVYMEQENGREEYFIEHVL